LTFNSISITGLGLATPLGNTVATTWDALLAGQRVTDHALVDGIPHNSQAIFELARLVASQAIADARWTPEKLHEAALIVGTSKGPVEAWLEGKVSLQGLAEVAADLATHFKIAGPHLTLSTACASGLHALIRATMSIASGQVHSALVVAAESSVHPLFIGSFQRLGVLPPPGFGCRPFDRQRAGFTMSQAAAAVTLERKPGGVQIERFALGADAVHLTAGDPTGTSLRRLLTRALDAKPIDMIHAHATGTLANDPVELAVLESVLDESNNPILYSHKGALGHSLGAAGLVSATINCLCHRHGVVPPNVAIIDPLPMSRPRLSQEAVHQPIRRSLVLSSGFGGAMAAVTMAGG
jgi:3-oxoacyl-[acyl-carrier-protein] synthase II